MTHNVAFICDCCGKDADELTQKINWPFVVRNGINVAPMVCDACLGKTPNSVIEDVDKLAHEFARVLRQWLTAEEMTEVIRKNREEYTSSLDGKHHDCCASHDFCDANMAMLEAVKNLELPDFTDYEDETPERDAALDMVNDAWEIARNADFFPPQEMR